MEVENGKNLLTDDDDDDDFQPLKKMVRKTPEIVDKVRFSSKFKKEINFNLKITQILSVVVQTYGLMYFNLACPVIYEWIFRVSSCLFSV